MKLPPATYVEPEEMPLRGLHPHTFQPAWGFTMSWPLLRHLERFGPRQKFFDAFLIENALERPTALLEGLKRKNYDNGLCYCHVPTERYVGESKQIPSPAQKVFCVYAEPTPNGAFQIIDWEWRRVETGATGVPKNWRRDFERLIWPTN